MLASVVRRRPMTVPVEIKSERMLFGTHNAIKDQNALNTHIEITTTTTRL